MEGKLKYIITIIIILLSISSCLIYLNIIKKSGKQKNSNQIENKTEINNSNEFTINIIKNSIKNENYLISPYSIEVALNMLKQGATNNTKKELENVVKNRNLNIDNNSIKTANALFIKNIYKDIIEDNFINELKTTYSSEILYDEFTNPNIINNWVDKKTDKMISKILDKIDPDFVLGLANAIAIDVKWQNKFLCENTKSEIFTKEDGSKINVEMMQNNYKNSVKYLDSDIKGIILPYEEKLEFIALLPNNISDFIKDLTTDKLNDILNSFSESSSTKRVNLSLPRFKYEYDLQDFKNILISMGIKDAFDEKKASFNSIITKENLSKINKDNIYVSDAIHKTYIDLNETGTKASAVTYFGVFSTSAIDQEKYDETNLKFDKPFIYMIRDIESKEIIFFGTVYEPNIWNGLTCTN